MIGGSGFLGSNLIKALVNRGEKNVHNIDLHQPSGSSGVTAVPFQSADITSAESLKSAMEKIKPDVIFHTASPAAVSRNVDMFRKVNVEGTENIISAAQRANVKVIVYTSSASVVFEGKDLVNVDERMPYPEKHFDAYDETKAEGERLILAANTDEDTEGLKTVALRPAGIFGPNDRQAIPKTINVLKTGKQNVQIGDNKNLSDFTYVENLVHAHLLAADKLLKGDKPYPRELLASVHLPIRNAGAAQPDTYLERGVPTSENRPDVAGATDYARSIPNNTSSNLTTFDGHPATDIRPVIRNKFDQFFHLVNPEIPSAGNPIPDTVNIAEDSIKVAGEIFFITNGQPIPFWDFMRGIWREYDPASVNLKKVWHIPKDMGYSMAYLAEWAYWFKGEKEGSFDRYKVGYTTVTRYYNIEKARRALGYEPLYSLEEGIRRSVAWYKENEK